MPSPLRLVRDDQPSATDLISEFTSRYSNVRTQAGYAGHLHRLFADTGAVAPSDLTQSDLFRWCAGEGRLANNSVRGRTTAVASFLKWCAKNSVPAAPASCLTDHDSPLRQFRPTYGKVQAPRPARWLTRDEAFGPLIAACQDDTVVGLRDEIGIRLGLSGMRASEIGALTVGNLNLAASPPSITWTAKGNKPRRAMPGPALVAAMGRYLALYADALAEKPAPDAPLLCPRLGTRFTPSLKWGTPFGDPRSSVHDLVTKRALAAGLGHVAPHDLRRTAAGILHHEKSADGGHRFDLLDIQKVLGHADPATTMRSYLDPMDTGVVERAGTVLD
jgi:integrase